MREVSSPKLHHSGIEISSLRVIAEIIKNPKLHHSGIEIMNPEIRMFEDATPKIAP